MKKKSVLLIVVLITVMSAMTMFFSDSNNTLGMLFIGNVEALTSVEQPDVNKCISDPNYDCEALHPTNPELDVYRENARW